MDNHDHQKKNLRYYLSKLWRKLTKKKKKRKCQTAEQENQEHFMDQSLCKSSSTTSLLSEAPPLDTTSLYGDDFEPPNSLASFDNQMPSGVSRLSYRFDDSSFLQYLEFEQPSYRSSSLNLISSDRYSSDCCISIDCLTLDFNFLNSFNSQFDSNDLFQHNSTYSIEALDLAQHSGTSHQCDRSCMSTVGASLCFTPARGNKGSIFDRDSEDIMETEVTEAVRGKSHFGKHKRVPEGNNDFTGTQTQSDILNSADHELETCIGKHHKKQKLQTNNTFCEPTTKMLKKHVDSHQFPQLRQNEKEPGIVKMKDSNKKHHSKKKAHLFEQKKLRGQKIMRKKAVVSKQKCWDRKNSLKRTVHAFLFKGLDGKQWGKKQAHVFHLNVLYRKGSLKRKALVHQKGGNRKGSLRRQAHAFNHKSIYKKGSPRNEAPEFKQKSWDRKGKPIWKLHAFRQKGRDKKEKSRRKSHVFHQKGWGGKEILRKKTISFNQQDCDRRESLRKKAHAFHQNHLGRNKGNMLVFQQQFFGRQNCLLKNVHLFQMRVFDGKDGVEVWAKEQLFCKTPVSDHKCSRASSENKKRKKYLNTPRKLLQKIPWKTWQTIKMDNIFGRETIVQKPTMNILQQNLKNIPGNLPTESYQVRGLGQTIEQPMGRPVYDRRPGGKPVSPSSSASGVYSLQPRNQQTRQDTQNRPQQPIQPVVQPTQPEVQPTQPEVQPTQPEVQPTQPEVQPTHPEGQQPLATQPEVQQTSQLGAQQDAHAAQLSPEQSQQDSRSIGQQTAHSPAVHHDVSQTEQAAGELETYSADFQKKLPSATGSSVFQRKRLELRNTCQIDCIVFSIFLLVHLYPEMEQTLNNSDDDFQWLYLIWRKCKIGKSDDAKLSVWLRHGFSLPQDDSLDFKVELEADWILKPLNIKIIHQKSRCQTCNKECSVFGEDDQQKYFQDSIRAFAKRCLKPMKQFTSFQELFNAWSAEDVPCPKCDNGYCHVTRRLDCAQGLPPLLPVPTFFEVSESSGSNTQLGEFLLPVQLNDQTLEQPQGFTTGNNQYRLHSMSYAILKQDNRTGETYPHERCKVWDDGLDLWMYYDGESWNEQYRNYKLRTARDKTPGKSYRVAYFRLV